MISQKTLRTLEFDKILLKLRQFCINEDTADFIMSLNPSTDYNEVLTLLNQTYEADRILHICLINPLEVFDNIDEVLKKAPKLSMLSFLEILKTARFLRSSRIFKNSIDSITDEKIKLFKEFANAVYIDQNLEKEITRCILSDEEMSSDASKELSSIRIKIKRCNENVKSKLNSIIKNEQKYLSDAIITIRQGRYVVPVKSESRANIKGLIHDQSSSGATVFIEPMEVVELNNELRILQIEEQREIDKIVLEFTKQIGQICPLLKENLKILLNADLIFAKAKYAKATRSTMPVINARCEMSVKSARHPLIDPKCVVPIDLKIGSGYKILIITGPNTGGKTVTLKLCGLLCIMAMCGMFIPAQSESSVSVFDSIFCDIGDEQSIEQSLSTFSSHIKNIAEVLNNLKGKTLILFDELGAGTDPKEGAALALSIVDYLNKNNVTALITTHYSELKEYSFVTDGVQNASMDFNIDTYSPTFKLKIGIPGSSNAIEIAKRLNLKEEIISNARSHLSEDKINFENVLKSAEKSRFEAEKTSEELEAKKEELSRTLKELNIEKQALKNAKENLLSNSKAEAKKIVSKAAIEADEIINEIKRILNSPLTESSLLETRQLKNKLQINEEPEEEEVYTDLQPVKLDKLKINDTVFVKSLNSNGVLCKILDKKNKAIVKFGSIESMVDLKDLYLPKNIKGTDKKDYSSFNSNKLNTAPQNYGGNFLEINLLGQNTIEAVSNAEVFIDNAIMQNLKEIKIIHGIGTGALKDAISKMLRTHKGVKEYRLGRYGEGESGVTIITLK